MATNVTFGNWDNVPVASKTVDIQSGRNVYIEVKEFDAGGKTSDFVTTASAEKILKFINEGFFPLLYVRGISHDEFRTDFSSVVTACKSIEPVSEDIYMYSLMGLGAIGDLELFAYSDALDKPFTTVARVFEELEDQGNVNA